MQSSVKVYGNFAGFYVCFYGGFVISKSKFKFLCGTATGYKKKEKKQNTKYKKLLNKVHFPRAPSLYPVFCQLPNFFYGTNW